MIRNFTRITVVSIRKPARKEINRDLQWFCSSMGLFNERDKENSCFRVFIELLKAAKKGKPVSSDEVAHNLGLSRGTVIFHINKLISAGLVTIIDNKYILRHNDFEELVKEVRTDIDQVFKNIQQIASDLDEELGLEKR